MTLPLPSPFDSYDQEDVARDPLGVDVHHASIHLLVDEDVDPFLGGEGVELRGPARRGLGRGWPCRRGPGGSVLRDRWESVRGGCASRRRPPPPQLRTERTTALLFSCQTPLREIPVDRTITLPRSITLCARKFEVPARASRRTAKLRRGGGRRRLPPKKPRRIERFSRQSPPSPFGSHDFAVPCASVGKYLTLRAAALSSLFPGQVSDFNKAIGQNRCIFTWETGNSHTTPTRPPQTDSVQRADYDSRRSHHPPKCLNCLMALIVAHRYLLRNRRSSCSLRCFKKRCKTWSAGEDGVGGLKCGVSQQFAANRSARLDNLVDR